MQVYLHPTRNEALTASPRVLTRWSLATNPATLLAQMPFAHMSLFTQMWDPCGQLQAYGGVTASADGLLLAMQQPQSRANWAEDLVLEWRHWADLSIARTSPFPQMHGEVMSLGSSPDGRWLVLGPSSSTRLYLLDWQTGEVMSHHAIGGNEAIGLAFDPTSTFVAAFASDENWGHCMLWQLQPAEQTLRRAPERLWWSHGPPDEISGSMALSLLHWELDRTGIEWPYRDLASKTCQAAFSPDSRIVIFNLMNTCYSGFSLELVAYDVSSGRRLWCAHEEQEIGDSFLEEIGGSFLVAPDGETLLVPMRGDTLLKYRLEDGALLERLPSGLSEPVQALAFDHDGKLWLATEEQLVQYQPQG